MRTIVRLGLAAPFLAISFAAACSDSTGPGQQSAAQTAAHFDSLALSAQADTNSAFGTRSLLTTLIEIPAALGAVSSSVSVTTANGAESWRAYELSLLSAPGASDSSFVVLMFRDADAHTVLIAFYDSTGTLNDVGLVTGDTIPVSPIDLNGTTSLTSVGNACATPSASLVNPELGFLGVGECHLAKFRSSTALSLPSTPGLDAALMTLSFSNATVNGVRVIAPAEGTPVRRLREILRAAAADRRH
jgi:hypothetical protein